MILITLLLWSLCGFLDAIKDKVQHHHDTSIFIKIANPKWAIFFAPDGWKNKYVDRDSTKGRVKWRIFKFYFNKPVQLTDSFHLCKMLMIGFYGVSLITFQPVKDLKEGLLLLLLCYTVRNLTFSLFYKKLLNA